jgi:hypothetical protein
LGRASEPQQGQLGSAPRQRHASWSMWVSAAAAGQIRLLQGVEH